MKKKLFLNLCSNIIFLLTLLYFPHNPLFGQEGSKPPNVILIMVDDLGFETVGCYGGTSYKTPNIDKMAKSGLKFNQAYAQPLCTNTRVKLMTGKYNFRNWSAFGILDPGQKTFGHLMQEAGYATCIVGKWQLQSYDPIDYPGAEFRRDTGMKVDKAGFDEYCLWHTGHTEDKGSRYADPTILQNGRFLSDTKGKYGPDIFTSYLNEFVKKDRDKPFFVYYPMALTHNPFSPTPDSKIWANTAHRMDDETTYFKDMVEYCDKIVGDILQNLEDNGLLEETLVLFYADNGTHQLIFSKMKDKTVQGGKGLTIETGIRVPLIASWPGHIQEGTETNELIDAIDFLPTLLDVGGNSVPENFLTDGESFLPILEGKHEPRRDWIYMYYNPKPGADKDQFAPAEFVMNSQFKLYGDGRFYNTKQDMLEKTPLKEKDIKPEIKSLKTKFRHILDSLKKYPAIGKVERLDPALDDIVSPHCRIEVIAEGFTWSEGPVWQPNGQKLLFSDVPQNKIYEWNNLNGLSVHVSPAGYTGTAPKEGGIGSNGLTLDPAGNLVICQQGDRALSKLKEGSNSSNPRFEQIVSDYEGKKFNSPNDLTYDAEGNLYFTDPTFGLGKSKGDIGFAGVYFLSKEGKLTLLSDDIEFPNGIAVSHDHKTLYIADSHPVRPSIIAYDIVGKGKINNKRIFFDATALWKSSISKQKPDGLKIDKNGNVFMAGPDGVLIFSPEGKHLGTLKTFKRTSNCAFSEDGRMLYVTCDDIILRINLKPYSK
ncbi:sulfatase-like hydrolase/transferase [Flexithrix dorotheae]|uniref:sulfatase-like hydrolase/transferase n=1 Tax=Flexithrix dorotheae TaxID=70993 RepID=UPI00036179C5|nr:sulfatase-like hydrolase/transferase [Flexithrix dorotheae]